MENSVHDTIEKLDFREALSSRYLSYAITTIKSRSLPDVRDGLKPVHRRILFAMLKLKLDPKAGFKKCARVVGDVVGKYHPHGEISIYDALVRMAQSFASRYPLVEGQGNFGSVDGDAQAAMRYTEAKLTPYAMLLLDGIAENAVDFIENYDESESEPVVLPSIAPNLLANGAEGIAVGMATSIPPHNLRELFDASIYYLGLKQEPLLDRILDIVKGPDLPTGGVIYATKDELKIIYEKGRGSLRVRAKYHIEEKERGSYEIVVTEIPYMVTKQILIEKFANLVLEKKLPLVETFQDQSAEDIRIIITPKSRNVDALLLMETLFKNLEFEVRLSINMNVISNNGSPQLMGICQILSEYIEHLKVTHQRRLNFRLDNIQNRIDILKGYVIAYLNLDEVIRIIRYEDEPKFELIRKFKLNENQAESILNMRLRALRKLEEMVIKKEMEALQVEEEELQSILSSEDSIKKYLVKNIKEVLKKFPDKDLLKRRTQIELQVPDVKFEERDFVERENITVTLSKKGWIRAVRGHEIEDKIKYKEGDAKCFEIETTNLNKVLLFCANGKIYCLNCADIAITKSNSVAAGDPLKLIFDFDSGNEKIIDVKVFDEQDKYILASSDGYGFVVEAKHLLSQTRKGKQILNVKAPSSMVICEKVHGNMVASLGENRRLAIFNIDELPNLKRGKGVIIQRFKQGGLKGIKTFDGADGLKWRAGKRMQHLENAKLYFAKRGSLGKIALTKLWIK